MLISARSSFHRVSLNRGWLKLKWTGLANVRTKANDGDVSELRRESI